MRVEQIGDATLYLGDCNSILPTLKERVAVVSDPPYGINYVHGAEKMAHATKFAGVAIAGDDKPFDPKPWISIGPCVLWGANHFSSKLPGEGRWLVWDKRDGSGYGKAMSDIEMAWVSGPRKADRLYRQLWDGFNKAGERGIPRVHPTQKPIELMQWCLQFVPDNIAIFDPFMGSGTTGVACAKLGRKFIGIEIDDGYFDIACERIRKAYDQPDMFVERPAPAKQLSMLGGGE